MGLLQRLLGREEPRADDDVLAGVEFTAILHLDTPLAVLDRHGEFVTDVSLIPTDIDGRFGTWVPVVDWDAIGIARPPEGRMATPVGPVHTDGGTWLQFLKSFRRVVEAGGSTPEMVRAVHGLLDATPDGEVFREKLGADFVEEFFAERLTEIEGIGQKTARSLFDAGFYTVSDLQNARDADLLAVEGVGRSAVARIRSHSTKRETRTSDHF